MSLLQQAYLLVFTDYGILKRLINPSDLTCSALIKLPKLFNYIT